MIAYTRFFNPETDSVLFDLPVVNASVEFGLNQSTRWSMTVDLNVVGIERLFQGLSVEFYLDDVLVFEGQLQEFSPVVTGSDTVSLSGHSFLDALYDKRSYPQSYYTDVPMIGVLNELLLEVGWAIGDVGTTTDIDQTLTKDLRGEKNALTQIKELVEGIESTYFREGDTVLGTRRLDIGIFQKDSGISLVMPSDFTTYDDDEEYTHILTNLTYTVDFTKAIHSVRMEGGRVRTGGADRVINLGDAALADINRIIDTDFPIIEDSSSRGWVCVNNRDYPYVGGTIQVNPSVAIGSLTQFAIGDSHGSVEQNLQYISTFVPFPGKLKNITIWWGTNAPDAQVVTDLGSGANSILWEIWEVDPNNLNTILDGPIHSQRFSTDPIWYGGQIYPNSGPSVVTPDTEVILEAGKIYGLVHRFETHGSTQLFRHYILMQNASPAATSYMQTFRRDSNADPAIGSVFDSFGPIIMPMRLETDPTSRLFSGFSVEKQSKYAPEKTGSNATAAEIQGAGEGLLSYAKAFLNEHKPQVREYSASAIGTKRFPKPGDTVRVRGKAVLEYYDSIGDRVLQSVYDEVDADLRVSGYTLNFSSDQLTINYKLLDDDGISETDRLLNIYDRTERREPPEGEEDFRMWDLVLDTLTTTVGPASPDTTLSDGRSALSVSMSILSGSVPSLPINTQDVYMTGLPYGESTSGDLIIEMVSEPEFSDDGTVDFKIAFLNRGWEYRDTADLTVKLVWR